MGFAFTSYTLKALVTDVLGIQAQVEINKEVKVLGNSLQEVIDRSQSYLGIPKYSSPMPLPPGPWQSIPELTGLPTMVNEPIDTKAAFRHPNLIVNIRGTTYVASKS